jgi:hypothetical protein
MIIEKSELRKNYKSDTLLNSGNKKDIYIPESDFTYAGNKRYTIFGTRALKKSKLSLSRGAVIGTAYLGAFLGVHFIQRNAWWKDKRTDFHFQDDWDYAMQADKAGHFFGGYLTSYFLSEGLMATGVNYDVSTNVGALLGLVFDSYVELEDGYGYNWGFSPSDLVSDVLGVQYFLAQHYIPYLQNFTPKWQYIPTKWSKENDLHRPATPIDDYNGTTIFLSADIHNILPEKYKKFWPSWLNLAIGYGARDVGSESPSRRYVISLDYNIMKILPSGSGFWNWIRQTLNYIKFPSPAVEFSNNKAKFYLFYPFKISANM